LLFDYPTLETLAGHVVRDLLAMECRVEPAGREPEAVLDEADRQTIADVEVMSEEEMDALVKKQLEKLGG
jgi:hypothetical protein